MREGPTLVPETEADPALSHDTTPPPPTFTEARRPSRQPPPMLEDGQWEIDSEALTLPGPYAVPKLAEPVELPFYLVDQGARDILALVDGVRSIAEIAELCGMACREVQLRFTDLRDHGVVSLD
jgi:hypothetical protein